MLVFHFTFIPDLKTTVKRRHDERLATISSTVLWPLRGLQDQAWLVPRAHSPREQWLLEPPGWYRSTEQRSHKARDKARGA